MGGNQSSSSLQSVVSFFNTKAATSGIENAMGITSPWITFTIWVVQVIGFVALGIWMVRIGIDIIALTTHNLKIGAVASKFGTGGTDDGYSSAKEYIVKNLPNIIFVVVLTMLMVTGYLYRILALALGGIGTILNVVFGLDIEGITSAADATAWKENLEKQRPQSLQNTYNQQLTTAKGLMTELYDQAADGTKSDNPQYTSLSRQYTTAMAKAQLIADTKTIKNTEVVTNELKLDANYFSQHTYDSNVCNDSYFDKSTLAVWLGGSGSISCGTSTTGSTGDGSGSATDTGDTGTTE